MYVNGIMGVFTRPVIEIEIEIRGQSRFTKNVIEIEFQSQADSTGGPAVSGEGLG